MIDGIQLKICGLTSLEDAAQAAEAGADFLGFILHPASPRYLPLERYLALADRLPSRGKVAVAVEPTLPQLAALNTAGFDFFQIHFRHDLAAATVASWAETVGRSRLWLAPKLPPAQDVPAALLPLADTFLLDTFHPDKFGGTGETGDWTKFALHQKMHPTKTWILAGGLNPENISEALGQSGARFVDVNSGVESAPGVKDHGKIAMLVWAMTEG
jgi:phosphoribosylanthranilate isomerase